MNDDCVWPGDFDKNGIVDHRDYLMWGVFNSHTGAARDGQISWRGHTGEDWSDTFQAFFMPSMGMQMAMDRLIFLILTSIPLISIKKTGSILMKISTPQGQRSSCQQMHISTIREESGIFWFPLGRILKMCWA